MVAVVVVVAVAVAVAVIMSNRRRATRQPVTTPNDPLQQTHDPILAANTLKDPTARAHAIADALETLEMPEVERWRNHAHQLAQRFSTNPTTRENKQ